ncbi:unnamed protein product [Microthlaspi erraticum]|uniref:BCAS3 domain-containing protein n=1 Tax=Microthlaspi erraticum TaxID=1685480 RepID=A0A6D2KBA6_9BRAS|nr:unnamed protein product [Microthlaspi erraticum]
MIRVGKMKQYSNVVDKPSAKANKSRLILRILQVSLTAFDFSDLLFHCTSHVSSNALTKQRSFRDGVGFEPRFFYGSTSIPPDSDIDLSNKETKRITISRECQSHGRHRCASFHTMTELQMYQPSQPPLWAMQSVSRTGVESDDANNGGPGEMELEGIQTKTIEVRTRNLVPAYGYLRSPNSQQVTIVNMILSESK